MESLFDVVARARRFETTKALYARMVLIARVVSQDAEQRSDIGVRCERFLAEQSKGVLGGLLLIFPKHLITSVETSVDVLVPLVTFFRQLEQQGHVANVRVLQTADASRLLLSRFHFRIVNLSTSKIGDSKPTDAVDAVVGDCLTTISKLSLFVASVPQASLEQTLDNLHEAVPELLTPQGMLEYLVRAEELDSAAEFLARYAGPMRVVLDSEIVWPYPVRLFPYE